MASWIGACRKTVMLPCRFRRGASILSSDMLGSPKEAKGPEGRMIHESPSNLWIIRARFRLAIISLNLNYGWSWLWQWIRAGDYTDFTVECKVASCQYVKSPFFVVNTVVYTIILVGFGGKPSRRRVTTLAPLHFCFEGISMRIVWRACGRGECRYWWEM